MTSRKRVFSGMQPTGDVHLGNLMGALDNWVRMQDEYETYYCVVDLHAMTIPFTPADMKRDRHDLARIILASGVDPSRSLLYYQSEVPQHLELAWILGTLAGLGQLERMTQFKEKADRAGQNLGLLGYPVLQAADILIHRVHAVPVGDDQAQHLELTRDLAERFNGRFGEEFPLPDRITPEIGARVMSLTDPTSKMSKSDPSPKSRILVMDPPDTILKKVKSAVTDTGSTVEYDWDEKPGISNLLEFLHFFTGRTIESLVDEYHDGGYGKFKVAVAEAMIDGLAPIQARYRSMTDAEVESVMRESGAEARKRADAVMESVRDRIGLS